MLTVYLLAGAVIPLLITPGLFFHFDTAPKVIVLSLVAAWALLRFNKVPAGIQSLWSRQSGRWFVAVALVQLVWFGIATLTSSRPWMSVFGSGWRRFGFTEILSLTVVAIAVAAGLSLRAEGIRTLLRVIVYAGLVASVYGILQYFGIDPFQPATAYLAHAGDSVIVRTPGTMGHADYFGWWLAIGFFCAMALVRIESGLWKRVATAAAACMCIAVVLSGTRAALIGVAAGCAGMALLSPSSLRIRPKHLMTAALAVMLFTAFVFSHAGTRLRARAVWSGDEPAGGARPLIWRDSLQMVASRPVVGFGPETFLAAFAPYQSPDLSRLLPDFHHESPHNLPLDALTSMGVPGLLLLLGWAAVARFAVAGARRADSPIAIPLSAALIASGAAAMFNAAALEPILLSLLVLGILTASCSSEISVSSSLWQKPPTFHHAGVSARATPGLRQHANHGGADIQSARLLPHEARAERGGAAKWMARTGAASIALCLVAFSAAFAVGEFRLQQFREHPGGASYQAFRDVSLPGAAEDLYASRVLQQECAKQVKFMDYLTCRQQAMRAAGRALSTADDTANAWYNLSMMSAAQNEIVWTRRGLEGAARASPNWFKPHWALARLLSQTGETKQAADEAARAAFLDSNRDPEVVKTLAELEARLR